MLCHYDFQCAFYGIWILLGHSLHGLYCGKCGADFSLLHNLYCVLSQKLPFSGNCAVGFAVRRVFDKRNTLPQRAADDFCADFCAVPHNIKLQKCAFGGKITVWGAKICLKISAQRQLKPSGWFCGGLNMQIQTQCSKASMKSRQKLNKSTKRRCRNTR